MSLLNTKKSIEFNVGDLFFEPVLRFYKEWNTYPFLHAPMVYPENAKVIIKGAWRGKIIPQLKYRDETIYRNLRNLDPIVHMEFYPDFNPPIESNHKSLGDSDIVESMAQQMFGDAYESARSLIEQKFGTDRKRDWPSELQFAYHVRNGCYHGNTFDIRNNSISTTIPTEWNGTQITYSENGKKVSQGFMWPADFICLLYDIQKKLI